MTRGFNKLIIIAVLMLLGASLFAQEAQSSSVNLGELYLAGGIFSHLLVGVAVIVFVLFLVKVFQLYIGEKIDTKNFYLKLKGYIKNNQYDEAVKISGNFKNTTMGRIFWNGILTFVEAKKAGKKGQELQNILQSAFDEAGLQLIPRIEAMLFWFDILGQAATLLGLLGTIFGLIQAFGGLANAPQSEQQAILTRGIYQAMGTTGMGLIVAIPTMFLKGFLQGRAEAIVNDIDEYSVKAINQINNSIKE